MNRRMIDFPTLTKFDWVVKYMTQGYARTELHAVRKLAFISWGEPAKVQTL
jgi:hypothetical protein